MLDEGGVTLPIDTLIVETPGGEKIAEIHLDDKDISIYPVKTKSVHISLTTNDLVTDRIVRRKT